jgi:hypothetical protein
MQNNHQQNIEEDEFIREYTESMRKHMATGMKIGLMIRNMLLMVGGGAIAGGVLAGVAAAATGIGAIGVAGCAVAGIIGGFFVGGAIARSYSAHSKLAKVIEKENAETRAGIEERAARSKLERKKLDGFNAVAAKDADQLQDIEALSPDAQKPSAQADAPRF